MVHIRDASTEFYSSQFFQKTLWELSKIQPEALTSLSQWSTMKIQQILFNSFTITTKWNTTDSRTNEIHNVVAEMIAVNNQPIYLWWKIMASKVLYTVCFVGRDVDSTSTLTTTSWRISYNWTSSGVDLTQRLMNTLKPNYQTASRKYMSEDVIQKVKLYQQVLIFGPTRIICSDFQAHWLEEEFTLQHRVLQMSHFRGPHTVDNIWSVLLNLLWFGILILVFILFWEIKDPIW